MKEVTKDNIEQVIKGFGRKLRRGLVAVTLNLEVDQENLIKEDKNMSAKQYVIAVGDLVKDLTPKDVVELDLDAMTKYVQSQFDANERIPVIDIKPIEVGEHVVALVDERVIKYVYINE